MMLKSGVILLFHRILQVHSSSLIHARNQCSIVETSSTFDLIDYLSDAGIFVNLFQLIDYIKTNEITKKV